MKGVGKVSAVWRPTRQHDWQPVEIVGDHASGQLVLVEVGKFYAGHFVAPRDQVRIAGPEFHLGRAA